MPTIPDDAFGTTFPILLQEGFLTSTALTMGMTALTSANVGNKGLYYAGFFQCSIGLERLFKLILILDHMARHEMNAPSRITLKSYGHDLVHLLSAIERLATEQERQALSKIQSDSTKTRIIQFFSDFAKTTRYYNFNSLAGHTTSNIDPLEAWKQILNGFIGHLNQNQLRMHMHAANQMANLMESHSSVVIHNLDRQLMSLEATLVTPWILQRTSKYAIAELHDIIACLIRILTRVTGDAQSTDRRVNRGVCHVPFLRELFDFVSYTRKEVLRKKRWP
jgi:hypothetical protein